MSSTSLYIFYQDLHVALWDKFLFDCYLSVMFNKIYNIILNLISNSNENMYNWPHNSFNRNLKISLLLYPFVICTIKFPSETFFACSHSLSVVYGQHVSCPFHCQHDLYKSHNQLLSPLKLSFPNSWVSHCQSTNSPNYITQTKYQMLWGWLVI